MRTRLSVDRRIDTKTGRNGHCLARGTPDSARKAPPNRGTRRARRGSHLWYRALYLTGPYQTISYLRWTDWNQDRVKDITFWTSGSHGFYVNLEGKLLDQRGGQGVQGTIKLVKIR